MKTLIKGGLVYDGTGAAPSIMDILIDGERIAKVAPKIAAQGAQLVDAKGMAVTPGFIDMHRHCDLAALVDPAFGALELAQGITGTVVGNCGLAPVPAASLREAWRDTLAPILGPIPENIGFSGYASYAEALKKATPQLHMGFMAASGAIRAAVKGFAKTALTPDEQKEARRHVEEAMDAGALGLSVGLLYQPDCHATIDELAGMLAPVADRDGLLCAHIRSEGDALVQAVDEVISIAARAGVRLNISHFKSTGMRNWRRKVYAAIDHIERAQELGMEIGVDFYPYAAGATTMLTLLPPEMLAEGPEAALRALETKAGLDALRSALAAPNPDWDNTVQAIGWDRIRVGGVSLAEHAAWQGRDMAALAAELGYDDPVALLCDLLVSEGGKVGMITMSMNQQDVDEIAKLPYAAVISDALYGGGAYPHPRLYGAFPRLIREYVLERKVLTMQQAIHRMTGMPAARLHLDQRGMLTSGQFADINVFDPQAFQDHADFDGTKGQATGMRMTFVNGHPASDRAGSLLTPSDTY